MIWLTNKWAQAGALIVAFLAWISIRDRRIAGQNAIKAKAQDHEKANHIRRRVDAIGELHDDAIEYRD